ncbi:unnamed protein product [marine sediment metagenome]|uniref:Methyltransferase domain-containing protein n=1 Tax=marine sediment metagenome TaxID=412755 RepID=X1DZU4_9ZZZZ
MANEYLSKTKMNTNVEFWNTTWARRVKQLPIGGEYRYDLRQYQYDVVMNNIPERSKVFDYACGLGIIVYQLKTCKQCTVSGCDLSEVAISYIKREMPDADFRVTTEIFGNVYDIVLALHIIEHFEKPVEWMKNAFKFTHTIIVVIPSNFSKAGEHRNMQWSNLTEFEELFVGFNIKRVDIDKYPPKLHPAFKPPVFVFNKK